MKYNKETCKVIECSKCDISINSNIVNGYGDIHSGVFILSESPGYYENKHGIPLIGKSGDVINELLKMIGLTRDMVYVSYVTKCKPVKIPTAVEVKNCSNYLKYELYTSKPKLIILLGNLAIKTYFGNGADIKGLRERPVYINNKLIYSMYHPSFILQNNDKLGLVNMYINKFKQIGNAYRYLINNAITKDY